eukprot:832987_1
MSVTALQLIDSLLLDLNQLNTTLGTAIISAIYIYPVYGLGPIALKANEYWQYDSNGFKYDRKFCVLNCQKNEMITPKTDIVNFSKLRVLSPFIENDTHLKIKFAENEYTVRMDQITNTNKDNGSQQEIDAMLTQYLGIPCKLSLCNVPSIKQYSKKKQWFPFLVMFEESIEALNQMISDGSYYSHDRFKPNILIRGWKAFQEDDVRFIQFQERNSNADEYVFKCDANELNEYCCHCTRIDPETGNINKCDNEQPSKAIKQYRNSEFGIALNLCNDTDVVHGVLSLKHTLVAHIIENLVR